MGLIMLLVGERAGPSETINDPSGVATSIAAAIVAENKHIENRFQWNLGLQGFLFASYAISLSSQTDATRGRVFADVVADVGIASCLVTLLGLGAAYVAINRCKQKWLGNSAKLDPVSARPFSPPWPSFLGRLPSTLITSIVLVAWLRLAYLFG